MKRSLLSIAAGLAAAALSSMSQGVPGAIIISHRRSDEPPVPKMGGVRNMKADKNVWKANLRHAAHSGKRGGSRPVFRGR